MIHISSVKDGSVIAFQCSIYYWMKVCWRNGSSGVVNLHNGLYIPVCDLIRYGFGEKVTIVANSLDELYREDEEN